MAFFWRKVKLSRILIYGLALTVLIAIYLFINMVKVSSNDPFLPLHVVYSEEDYSDETFKRNTDKKFIREPLEDIFNPSSKTLQFWNLPKRIFGKLFTEVTTANRDTSYPLAPDFTFHIEYKNNSVVIYEDYGPGCIYRIFMLPNLPTDAGTLYSMTAKNLTTSKLQLLVDNSLFEFTLEDLMLGTEWPFQSPLNTRHPKPMSGFGTYTPICYQDYMKITYTLPESLPNNLFEQMINCSANDMLCPVKIYSSVSRHKFPHGTEVSTFAEFKTGGTWLHKAVLSNVLQPLRHPEKYGPNWSDNCKLICIGISKKENQILFKSVKPGVISTIRMRVYDPATGLVMPDWTNLLVTMAWDGAKYPQVDRVPLGSLFGATASLNDCLGAAAGKRVLHCYHETGEEYRPDGVTGYFYFPMPFWKNASISIHGSSVLQSRVSVCFQILTMSNHYSNSTTGYFHAKKTYYNAKVDGWRNVLKLENTWGHIVGLFMDVDNLRANRGVSLNQRWAALQADPILYIDGSKSASVMGTGLEDYFSYGHGFGFAENTSYAFVGVHHAGPRKNEPLTWHCYRFHILDSIPFHDSIHFIMEGTNNEWYKPERQLTFLKYWKKKTSGETTLSHLILYYARQTSGLILSDKIDFSDEESEQKHNYHVIPRKQSMNTIFTMKNQSFLGQCYSNKRSDITGRKHFQGDKVTFTLNIEPENEGVILRREFFSVPRKWNEKAKLFVSGLYQGVWFIPMGTLVEDYSLQQNDFILRSSLTFNQTKLDIQIEPLTLWYDISYASFTVQS